MNYERDERKFDFHDIGLAIKKAREREGMTQEQPASIIDRDPRTVMYHKTFFYMPLGGLLMIVLCFIYLHIQNFGKTFL